MQYEDVALTQDEARRAWAVMQAAPIAVAAVSAQMVASSPAKTLTDIAGAIDTFLMDNASAEGVVLSYVTDGPRPKGALISGIPLRDVQAFVDDWSRAHEAHDGSDVRS